MSKLSLVKSTIKALSCLVLLLTAIGCDGGLFGTGDGGEIDLPTDSTSPSTDQSPQAPDVTDPGESTAPTDQSEPATPAASPISTVDVSADRVFQNQRGTGSNELPLFTLINTSSQPLNVVSSESVTPLINSTVEPGSISDHVELLQNQNSLSIINSDNTQPLLTFSSLDLETFTVTTLVAYDAQVPTTTPESASASALDVIALSTLTSSSNPSVAMLRIIQANQLGSNDLVATMTLFPNGSNPGSGEVDFENISLSNAADSRYMSVNAGTYQLQDSLGRFEPVSLSVEAATVYTLVITGTLNPVLIIAKDSNVIIQSDAN